jgi:hypothetical protein
MAIPTAYRANFDTLLLAARNDALALLECADVATGEPRYVVCAVARDPDSGDYLMTPFGHLCDGNPFEAYTPPTVG